MNKEKIIAAMREAFKEKYNLVDFKTQNIDLNGISECFAEAALKELDNEWVRVEDGLPEEGQVILAFDTEVHHCVYHDNLFYRHTIPASNDRLVSYYWTEITHWMPPPSPPKDK